MHPLSEGIEFALKGRGVKGIQWKLHESPNPPFDFVECGREGSALVGIAAGDGSWIAQPPMGRHRPTGPECRGNPRKTGQMYKPWFPPKLGSRGVFRNYACWVRAYDYRDFKSYSPS